MIKNLFFIITLFSVISCNSDVNVVDGDHATSNDSIADADSKIDSLEKEVISDYDFSMVDEDNSADFVESLVKIEKEFGQQWDFCTCVVKNDSINKAFSSPVSDKEFDRLSDRFDVIDTKCKAFLVQNPNVTPEERAEHEKKVKKCLKEAAN